MRILFFTIVILASVAHPLLAQPKLSTKNAKAIALYTEADNYRVRGQYAEATSMLKQAIEKDSKFEEAYYRLALIYKAQENFSLASATFEQGLSLVKDEVRRKMYIYDLASVNLWNANYAKAGDFASQYLTLEKTDKRKIDLVTVWKSQATYALENTTVLDYTITVLSDTVNAYPMQYFPVLTADNDQLIFTARFGGARNDNEDLVVSRKMGNGWSAPVSISSNINTAQREGACTISADGRHLIFTICGPYGCDLWESRKTGNVWSKPKNLGPSVNSSSWDAQPSLSADGRELYFVSDRKTGIGGYDIWYSQLNEGVWSKAQNLGPSVNTPFDEISPYIHVNNQILYVVSNGYPGYGGYDIYSSEKKEEVWLKPVNMGKPLNDHKDQYSFIVASGGASAYYSREESKNRSRLYKIELPVEKIVKLKGNVVKGVVSDKTTTLLLQSDVELYDLDKNKLVSKVKSDSVTGEYLMVLPGGAQYGLYFSKPGYLFLSLHFDYTEAQQAPLIKNAELIPARKDALVVLNNLFFDTDQYALRKESITELEEVVKFLKQNPAIRFEIAGHTDNTGTETHNIELSQKRANSVAEYLKNNGIEPNRVGLRGYGSKKPVKPNDSEANRQLNRRIEFRIL